MQKYAIGLDNGGTVSKAAVFDLEGNELAVASRQTEMLTPKPGYTERDMEQLWQLNCACVREAVEKAGIDAANVIGIAVAGHGKGLYAWGKNGKPAYNGIISTDNRAWQYPEKWKKDGTFDKLYPQLCQQLVACQQAPLLAWLKDHDRAVYDNIQYAFSVKDYIRFRLTGEAYSEATDISGSGLMDVKNACFDKGLLEQLGIGEVYDMLAPLRYSSDFCGRITAEASALCGLPEGTPVAGGMFDIDACAIAMDITDPSQMCTITGTWSINEFIAREPKLNTQVSMNSLYAIPGYYLLEECSATSAGNLEWVIQNLFANEQVPEGRRLYDYLDDMAAGVDPASDVYFLPFLYGSNAHPLAKGSFLGLTSFHTKAHMLRAVYEGVAYSAKTHINRLLSAREKPAVIRMAGGAAKSAFWVQMFADILGIPVQTVRGVKELGALGCAMAAAVAAGEYPDYPAAAKQMIRLGDIVQPDAERNAMYEEKFAKYSAVSAALDTVWQQFEV